jgi:ribonuclease R
MSRKTNKMAELKGRITVTQRGSGYVDIESFNEGIEIKRRYLNTAMHNDTVLIALHPKIEGQRRSGEVISIINRAKMSFVGTIQKQKGRCFVLPDDRRLYVDIFIPIKDCQNAKDGQKVQVRITEWSDPKKNPEGKIVKILGKKGEHEVEMNSIILESGITTDFSSKIRKEATHLKKIKGGIDTEELAKRRDCRNIPTFTIDPITAKDFDDAISLNQISDSKYEVGVHIADVSYFVQPNSLLDKEARERGFSVYLVDRTIPMLPEILSNDLCSLNPDEDKYAFSGIFKITPNGDVEDVWFGKTVIRSDKRFSYEEAQKTIDAGKGKYYKELAILKNIADNLSKKKYKEGAISFESDEVGFELDAKGRPIKVFRKKRLDTHKLVEEFMLLANKKAAEMVHRMGKDPVSKRQRPLVYRVHDKPNREKIENLSVFLKALGYDLKLGPEGTVSSQSLNTLLKNVEGGDNEDLIKTTAIRAMAKAAYSTKNIGHYGLAFDHYTHFTSPIRRYPDLLVHRLIHDHLRGKTVSGKEFMYYEKVAKDSSDKEIRATNAERESIKYKQAEYMSERIGNEYDGIVSGITEWGIYVEEKQTKTEGMIQVRNMTDDFYVLDQKNYSLTGEKTGKKYSLGDSVRIRIKDVDVLQKTVDLEFA